MSLRVGDQPWVCTQCRQERNEEDFPVRYLNGELYISARCRDCLTERGEPEWDDLGRETQTRSLSVRQILAVAGASCVVCGSKRDLAIDHIVPLSQGGTSVVSNLQVLCEIHHLEKHADDPKLARLISSGQSRRKAGDPIGD
jgi:5-methylcytosine-specific restriction endonuclease McrA